MLTCYAICRICAGQGLPGCVASTQREPSASPALTQSQASARPRLGFPPATRLPDCNLTTSVTWRFVCAALPGCRLVILAFGARASLASVSLKVLPTRTSTIPHLWADSWRYLRRGGTGAVANQIVYKLRRLGMGSISHSLTTNLPSSLSPSSRNI